jgi:hypothetical protein
MRGTFLPAALILSLAAASTAGAAFTATAVPDRKELYLGQVLVVTVMVKDAAGQPTVRPDAVSACTITPLGPGRRTGGGPGRADGERLSGAVLGLVDRLNKQLEGAPPGKEKTQAQAEVAEAAKDLKELRRSDYVFEFRVQPEKSGTVTIPAFRVLAEGEEAVTKSFEIKVETSGAAPWLHLEWALSNPRPKVGEDVQLFLDVRMDRRDTSLGDRKFLHLPLRNILLFVPPEGLMPTVEFGKALPAVAKAHAPPAGKVGFRIKGLPDEVLFEQVAAIPGEKPPWFRYRLPVPVRFTRPGTVVLPPLRALGEVYVPLLQEAFVGTKKKQSTPAGEWMPFADTGEALKIEVAGR